MELKTGQWICKDGDEQKRIFRKFMLYKFKVT